jgi:hypothetical protein
MVRSPNCTTVNGAEVCTRLYLCVTDGCPDAGATQMKCKDGYQGPLCAACASGYYIQVGTCKECQQFRPLALVFWLCFALVAWLFLKAYRRYLHQIVIMPYVKIMVSFVTISATIETNYGVKWPSTFASVLGMLSALSLNVSAVLQTGFQLGCHSTFTYYQRFGLNFGVLVGVLIAVHVLDNFRRGGWRRVFSEPKKWSYWISVHYLVFVYPTLSTQVFKVFSCHEVDGTRYLHTDYNLECDTGSWKLAVALACVLVLVFVLGFPALVFYKLWGYSSDPNMQSGPDGKKSKQSTSEKIDLKFLRDDYVVGGRSWMNATQIWEGIEMVSWIQCPPPPPHTPHTPHTPPHIHTPPPHTPLFPFHTPTHTPPHTPRTP